LQPAKKASVESVDSAIEKSIPATSLPGLEVYINKLQSKDDMERRQALVGLSRLNSPLAIPYIAQALEDPISDIVLSSVQLLALSLNESAIAPLKGKLTDPRPLVRASALNAIGKFTAENPIPLCVKALEDPEDVVRGEAVRLLAKLKNPAVAQLLVQALLQEAREQTRLDAALGLALIKTPETIQQMIEALQAPRVEIRRAAAISLRETHDKQTLESLSKAVQNDRDPVVRKICLEGLTLIADPSIIPITVKALADSDRNVKMAALESLELFKDFSTTPYLLRTFRDSDAEIADKATRIIGELKDPGSLPGLLELLSDLNPEIRSRSALALGLIGDKTTISALGKVVKDDIHLPALRAFEALDRFEDKAIVPWMVLGLKNKDFSVHSKANERLKQIPYTLVPEILLVQLENLTPEIRAAAALALGTLKVNSAAVALKHSSLRDPDPLVRYSADEALRAIQRINPFKRHLIWLILGIGLIFAEIAYFNSASPKTNLIPAFLLPSSGTKS
jgi:HEAT repeat protein